MWFQRLHFQQKVAVHAYNFFKPHCRFLSKKTIRNENSLAVFFCCPIRAGIWAAVLSPSATATGGFFCYMAAQLLPKIFSRILDFLKGAVCSSDGSIRGQKFPHV